MIIPGNPGKITDGLYCLGPLENPAYLLDGGKPAMFDAGVSFLGEHYVMELKKILGTRPLHYLFLSHVHFDHCGAAGYLKLHYPDLIICASPISAEIIAKPSAQALIKKLSTVPGMTESQRFRPFSVDRAVRDGDRIDLQENGFLEVFATPGHTRDMTSYYLPQLRTLIPSEAAGVPAGKGYIYAEFLVDYDTYLYSISRLAVLPVDRILCAHRFIYDGDDTVGYFDEAIRQTRQFKNRISILLEQNGYDNEAVGRIIKAEEYGQVPEPKLPEPAYDLNLKAKISTIARRQVGDARKP
ncbi:MAG: MBL fold metallo-hydrolase [bacterium]